MRGGCQMSTSSDGNHLHATHPVDGTRYNFDRACILKGRGQEEGRVQYLSIWCDRCLLITKTLERGTIHKYIHISFAVLFSGYPLPQNANRYEYSYIYAYVIYIMACNFVFLNLECVVTRVLPPEQYSSFSSKSRFQQSYKAIFYGVIKAALSKYIYIYIYCHMCDVTQALLWQTYQATCT